ncbi:unnamed protein product [Haemonchus placei]|uniref:Uncharacterized protein n=1 Tax=Haemonchus placei TaxID=6290 RepID=A0A3P7XBW0_HAEPC|nr:unnamed protein product [Haemonchus placei]
MCRKAIEYGAQFFCCRQFCAVRWETIALKSSIYTRRTYLAIIYRSVALKTFCTTEGAL